MKITKKQPLRQRGRSDEKRQSTKDAIREVYANGPQMELLTFIFHSEAIQKKLDLLIENRKETEQPNGS